MKTSTINAYSESSPKLKSYILKQVPHKYEAEISYLDAILESDYIGRKTKHARLKVGIEQFGKGVPIEDILNIEVSEKYCDSCTTLLGAETYCRTVKFEENE